MVYRRKKVYRRRGVKARSYSRKKYITKARRTSIPRSMNSNHMSVMLRTLDTVITNSNIAEQRITYRFQLSACLNYVAYQTMWEQYRINKVVITWKPIRVQSVVGQVEDVTPASTTNIPSYVVAIDNDDVATEDYTDTKTRYGSRERLVTTPGKVVMKPACLSEIYLAGAATAYSPQYGKWLDCRYATVPHYGVRLAMEPAEPAGNYALECKTKIYVSFKNRVI